ncbi:hypothetical protein FRB90_002167, partial [Tulasnella sp. 427]
DWHNLSSGISADPATPALDCTRGQAHSKATPANSGRFYGIHECRGTYKSDASDGVQYLLMLTIRTDKIDRLLRMFEEEGVSIIPFLLALLTSTDENHIAAVTKEFRIKDQRALIKELADNPSTSQIFAEESCLITVITYLQEMVTVQERAAGFHYNAASMTAEKLEGFESKEMGKRLSNLAPELWQLFGYLLNARHHLALQKKLLRRLDKDGDSAMESSSTLTVLDAVESSDEEEITGAVHGVNEDETQASLPPEDPQWIHEPEGGDTTSEDEDTDEEDLEVAKILNRKKRMTKKAIRRREALLLIRRNVLFSICMQSSNSRCNALQTVVGLFAHSCNAPERIVEMMAHAGLSVSPQSSRNMLKSMSTESRKKLRLQTSKSPVAIAYDNLDISFKTEQPTVEGGNSHQVHMTTGTYFPLMHGVRPEALRFSQQLWAASEINPERDPSRRPILLGHSALMEIQKESAFPDHDSRSYFSLMAWHVRQILLSDAVSGIKQAVKDKLRPLLGEPTARKRIPVEKTIQYPARAMTISVSSNSGNAAAISNLLRQADIKDEALEDSVLLVHGDLGTGDRAAALMRSRRIEGTAKNRLQYLIFLPGVFHIKMACADAIWRAHIASSKPTKSRSSHSKSIFHMCSIIRPKETSKLASNPGFRLTHNVINHLLLATISEAWKVEVEARTGASIEEWIPETWTDVIHISNEIVRKYVAQVVYNPTTNAKSASGDMVTDAIKLWNRDALLYVMTSHAANTGDVGRLEELLLLWIYMWKGTGKHRYAAHLARFLIYLRKGWEPSLAEAIRMNWLVNPLGKPDGFRGADWVVERNNLRHKRTYCGSGVNRTIQNIIQQSPLIEVFQEAHTVVERSFYLTKRTIKHPPPVMKKTLRQLQEHIRSEGIMTPHLGRTMPEPPINFIAVGLQAATSSKPDVSWLAEPEESESQAEETSEMTSGDIGVDI